MRIVENVKNIAWLLTPYWKYGKLFLILSLAIPVLCAPVIDILYVYFPGEVVDLLISGKSFSYVAIFALIVSGTVLLSNIIPRFFSCYFKRKQTYVDLKAKCDIYEKATKIDYKYIDNPDYYDTYTWALDEYSVQASAARDFVRDFLKYSLITTVLISMIATIGPWILIIEAVQMTLHMIINFRENKIGIKRKQELVPVNRRLSYYHRLFYIKDYAADMKATSLSKFVFDGYKNAGELNIEIINRYERKTVFLGILHETLFFVSEFIIIMYLIHNITIGSIAETGLFVTMILAFYKVDSILYGFIGMIRNANSLSLNAEKIRAFFEIKSDIEVGSSSKKLATSIGTFSVDLQNVGFSYENSNFSLSNFNLNIKPGEKLAIVGENGAGKSTFIKLLLRLYDVSEGKILINGNPIKEYDVRALRQKIGVAFQNPNIYAMTFAKNIELYNDLSETDLTEISERLDLISILEKNKVGYDAEMTREFDEKGLIPSGGEAQKIALARILFGDFGLLLLDEPSSALDPIAEYKMCEMILSAANKTTTIMVGHRLSATRSADRIILLDHGVIKESGTHNELMILRGKYYEMFTKQAENYVR